MTAVFGHFSLDYLNVRLVIHPFPLSHSLYLVAQFLRSFTCRDHHISTLIKLISIKYLLNHLHKNPETLFTQSVSEFEDLFENG
ncbi:unnamed protein product [Schistosoma spindalis]|nr:unnamed protein product [Schistosoma spindale]